MEVKIPTSVAADTTKKLAVVDIPGHFHYREQLKDTVEIARAIVVLLDAKEKYLLCLYLALFREKYGEAAEILYDIINKVTLLDHRVPVLIACNKQDLQFAKKATSIEVELEKEIEELRKVKRATQLDEANTKIGYLEDLKKKFSFIEMQFPVQFVECSVKNEDLTEVYKFINANF